MPPNLGMFGRFLGWVVFDFSQSIRRTVFVEFFVLWGMNSSSTPKLNKHTSQPINEATKDANHKSKTSSFSYHSTRSTFSVGTQWPSMPKRASSEWWYRYCLFILHRTKGSRRKFILVSKWFVSFDNDGWWITAAFAERSFSFFAEWTVKLFWISFDSFVWIPNETPIVSWLLVWRCSSIPKTSRDELPPTNFDWVLVEFWIFLFGSTHATLVLFLRSILFGLCPQKELSDGKGTGMLY